MEGLEVQANQTGVVVAVGDSITDGFKSSFSEDMRYPDFLQKRLLNAGANFVVVNAGISGNILLKDSIDVTPLTYAGLSLEHRLNDVLNLNGVTDIILLEGINDLLNDHKGEVTPEAITDSYTRIIERIHAKGINVIVGTLLPNHDKNVTAQNDTKRLLINDWIRTAHIHDGFVDFSACMEDPNHPGAFNSQYDSGDHVHPNDAGYKAMADCIDLSLLRGAH